MRITGILVGLSLLLGFVDQASAQSASGTFVETYPVTTTQTVNGTVTCVLTTATVVTCTFSQALQPNASISITIPSGL